MNIYHIHFALVEDPTLAPDLLGQFFNLVEEDFQIQDLFEELGSNVEFMQTFLELDPTPEQVFKVLIHQDNIACFDQLKAVVLAKASADLLLDFMRLIGGFKDEETLSAFLAANPDVELLRIAVRSIYGTFEMNVAINKAFMAKNPSQQQLDLLRYEMYDD